jgi:hypothetical protein
MSKKSPFVWFSGFAILVSFASVPAFAGQNGRAHGHGPCKQVTTACQSAGFIKGDWKKGDGLWRDCINPIMQGQSNVPGATRSLPSVDAGVVTACKAKRPHFGSGKVGS